MKFIAVFFLKSAPEQHVSFGFFFQTVSLTFYCGVNWVPSGSHSIVRKIKVWLWKTKGIYFPLNLELFPSENNWSTVKREGNVCGAFILMKEAVFVVVFIFIWFLLLFSLRIFLRQKQSTKSLCFYESVITVGFWWWLHFFHPDSVPKPQLPLTYLLFLDCA